MPSLNLIPMYPAAGVDMQEIASKKAIGQIQSGRRPQKGSAANHVQWSNIVILHIPRP